MSISCTTDARLLGQLITTRLAVLLVFRLVGGPRLRKHLARNLLKATVVLPVGVARRRVPSTAIIPDFTNPGS